MGSSFSSPSSRIEKQGIEIHRSFNAKATTVDQGPTAQARTGELGTRENNLKVTIKHHRVVTTCGKTKVT
jgi:hypothetical protein